MSSTQYHPEMKNGNFRNRNRNLRSRNHILTQEQYAQIIEAIEAGKYSWACLLILRFAGDNPLLYIPYRTANRLIKENQRADTASRKDSHPCIREEE